MKKEENIANSWTICTECQGRGKKSQRIRKKARLSYQRALDQFENTNGLGTAPTPPKGHLYSCLNCNGSGLLSSTSYPKPDTENYPHIAIIGGGIGALVDSGSGAGYDYDTTLINPLKCGDITTNESLTPPKESEISDLKGPPIKSNIP